jgi:hypothetical protein
MRAIVTDEQRRSRTEAGLPSIYFASPKRGNPFRKGRGPVCQWHAFGTGANAPRPPEGVLRGERRRSSVTYSRYAPSSLLVATQNRPAKKDPNDRSQH